MPKEISFKINKLEYMGHFVLGHIMSYWHNYDITGTRVNCRGKQLMNLLCFSLLYQLSFWFSHEA